MTDDANHKESPPAAPPSPTDVTFRSAYNELAELYKKRNRCDDEMKAIALRIALRDGEIAALNEQITQLGKDNLADAAYRKDHLIPIFRAALHGIHAIETGRAE